MHRIGHTRANDLQGLADGARGASEVDPGPLVGTWLNFDPATRGVVKVVVSDRGGVFAVRAYGACSPQPCDWGEVRADAFAGGVGLREGVGFRAFYDFGFLETIVAAYLNKRLLVVDTYNTFKDDSGRPNYFFRDHFYLH
jgi:hypothetical protein